MGSIGKVEESFENRSYIRGQKLCSKNDYLLL